MIDLFDKTLLPLALQYGISVFDFWNMTLKEILEFIKAVQEREKVERQKQYLQASLTANFVGCIISGKPIPSIYKVFPEIYQQENQMEQEKLDYQAMMLYKEQMLDYANRINKRNKAKKEVRIIDC